MAWRDRLGTRVVGDVRENLWMALDTLRAHKMRSGLAVIGIIVAVMTLISVVAILSGFDRNIQQGIQSFGTNTAFFNHLPSGPRLGRMSKELRMRKVLDYEDFVAVRDACTACVNSTVSVFSSAEVIEDYPEDKYGPRCPIFGLHA
jgi:ABC-type antimicrobial peptide transport system permease subunit